MPTRDQTRDRTSTIRVSERETCGNAYDGLGASTASARPDTSSERRRRIEDTAKSGRYDTPEGALRLDGHGLAESLPSAYALRQRGSEGRCSD